MAIAISVAGPIEYATYDELVSGIADELDRDDLSSLIPGWIRRVEARLNRLLRVPDMEGLTTLAVTTEATALPSDFLSMRYVYQEGSPDSPLQSMSPLGLLQRYRGRSGTPAGYAIVGDTIRVAPVGATTLEMNYYQRIPALSADNNVNWLLTKHADAYLYGALLHAEAYIDNPEKVSLWKAGWDEVVGEIMADGNRNRWGAGPLVASNGVAQVRGTRA